MAIPTHFALLAVAPGLAALRLLLLAVAAALTTHSVAPASGDDVGGPRSLGAGNRGGPDEITLECFRRSDYKTVVSRPVRRILWPERLAAPRPAAIPLGRRLPDGSCGLPGGLWRAGHPSPCLALLRVGFT